MYYVCVKVIILFVPTFLISFLSSFFLPDTWLDVGGAI